MVSIWMLCASRTPGSERHKALQAGPRPRAPWGLPTRPQRLTLSAARPRPGPAGEPMAGEPELPGESLAARRGRQKPLLAREAPSRAWQVLHS